MKNLADFMSPECRIKFGASLHWCRGECRLHIANAAAREAAVLSADVTYDGRFRCR